MALFRYRLEALLEQKRKALEQAQLAMAERVAKLQQEELRKVDLEAKAEQAASKATEAREARYPTGDAMTAEALQRRCEEARWLQREAGWARDAVLEQQIAIEDAADALESARKDMIEAIRQVEVLRAHRAKQEARFSREAERLENLEMDDVGSAQFMQRRGQ